MKNHFKSVLYATTISFCLGQFTIATAQETNTTVIPVSDQQELNIAIYNADMALIKDVRQTALIAGRNKISYENISAQIIPESAILNGKDIHVIEQNFDYDLITSDSLLSKSVGHDVILQTINPKTGEKEQQNATLIAYNGQPVIAIDNQIYTGFKGDILLKEMPSGLISKPSLSIDLNVKATNSQTLDLTYLSRGLSWQANYVAELNNAENNMNLNGFITLSNQSGTDFENADMQLVAGDVKIVRHMMARAMPMYAKGVNMMAEATVDDAMPIVENVSDFYVYSLPFKTSVKSQQTKQVSLLGATNIPLKKEYVFDNMLRTNYQVQNRKAFIYYTFKNTKEDGLGMALPLGTIRLYKNGKNGKSVFLGENTIQHTANTATIRLQMGEAFDIFADSKQTERQRISNRTDVSAYEITLKNGSKEDKEVVVYENFPGTWKITEESAPHQQETANRVKWTLSIPAEGKTTLTYRVRISNE